MQVAVEMGGEVAGMSDYIKRSDFAAALSDLLISPWAMRKGVQEALHLVQDMVNNEVPERMKMPAADVVEVVRCKDCKHFEQAECPWDELFLINVNGYCSRGERKEGEE